jgi:hypothetical protein
VADCKAKGERKKATLHNPAKAQAAGQQKKDADDSNPKVKRARSAYIFFGSEKRPAVKGSYKFIRYLP